jgi:hypothetical protein
MKTIFLQYFSNNTEQFLCEKNKKGQDYALEDTARFSLNANYIENQSHNITVSLLQ